MLRFAVVAHVFYQEQWPELASYLQNIQREFLLYVSIPDFSRGDVEILRDFPNARVVRVPNVGRDVAPFIRLLPHLLDCEVVCKIHTKRDVGRSGAWRGGLLRGVLGSPEVVSTILRAFETRPSLVLAGSRTFFLDGPRHVFGTGTLMNKYFGSQPPQYGFFGGTIFWVRPSLIHDFPTLFPQSDFIAHEDGDYHPEHAIERLFGVRAALTAGAEIGLVRETWFGRPQIKIVRATTPGNRSIVRAIESATRRRRFEQLLLQPFHRLTR